MNHADFCVIPSLVCNSTDETPLREVTSMYMA